MNTTRRSPLAVALCTFGLLAAGCDEPDPIDFADDELVEIVDNLIAAGYPESEVAVVDGEVIVGGDAVVTLAASREMLPADSDEGFRQYRTTNLINVGTICVDGSAYSGAMSEALDAALIEINSIGLDFVMIRTSGNEPGCDAVITATTRSDDGGKAGFPSNGLPYGTIEIGTQIEPYGMGPLTHVIVHELGHTIGLRHTDYYNRSISCNKGGDEGQGADGAHHIPGTPTTAWFNGSVMNSCYNTGSTGQWTDGDVTALVELYGTSFCDAYDGRKVALETAHDRFLKTASGVVSQQTYVGTSETMTVECHGDQVAFRNLWGKYLQAGSSSQSWVVGLQTFVGSWEKWTPVRQANGDWAFRSVHGRWLRAGDSGESWRFNQQTFVGDWEKYTLNVL